MAHRIPGRRTMAAAVAACLLAWPVAVQADTGGQFEPAWSDGAAINIVSASFDNKLVATVTIEVTCEPFEAIDPYTGEPTGETSEPGALYADILLMQAQGRSIAHATGALRIGGGAMYQGMPVVCDGGTVYRYDVAVTSIDMPLRRGAAVVGVTVQVAATERPLDGWYESDAASSGPTSVRLR